MNEVLDRPVDGADIARPLSRNADTDGVDAFARTMQGIVRNGAVLVYAATGQRNHHWIPSGYATCRHNERPAHEERWTALVYVHSGMIVVQFGVCGICRDCDRYRSVLVTTAGKPIAMLMHDAGYDGRTDGDWIGEVKQFGGKWFEFAAAICAKARRGLHLGKLVKASCRGGK